MKRFAAIALILAVGLFTIGCEKPAKKKTETTKPAAEAGAETKAADATPAPEAKKEEKKEEKK